MINETYINKKYDTIFETDNDDYSLITIKVQDNDTDTLFSGVVNAYPEDLAIYPLIKKCMMREDGHVVSYIYVSDRQLNLHFIAHLGGFLKINFEVPLYDNDTPKNCQNMISRLVPALNPEVDNYIQSGYICLDNDHGYVQNSSTHLQIYGSDIRDYILWENISEFRSLVSLEVDSVYIDLTFMSSDTLRHLVIAKSRLLSLDGIEGLPELTRLTIEGCTIPTDFVDVLSSYKHKITTIELIQCGRDAPDITPKAQRKGEPKRKDPFYNVDYGEIDAFRNSVFYDTFMVEIEEYCKKSGITLLY